MKKWLLILFALFVGFIAAIYVFIPSDRLVSAASGIRSSQDAAFRVISDEKSWKNWWPGEVKNNTFSFAGKNYTIEKQLFQGLQVNVTGHNPIRVVLLPVASDSSLMEWKTNWYNGFSPVSRWQNNGEGEKFATELATILQSFKQYVENTANVYGNKIEQVKVTDSIVLMFSRNVRTYPSTEQVYDAVGKLKSVAASQGAVETNFLMLHIDSLSNGFLLRVGLPVNKEVNEDDPEIEVKRMVLGLILVSDIKGGPSSIKAGMHSVEQYMVDFRRRAPAIPFESLVTDRSKEMDTSKWVTRIYYPVY